VLDVPADLLSELSKEYQKRTMSDDVRKACEVVEAKPSKLD
jgi:hypothetical protein